MSDEMLSQDAKLFTFKVKTEMIGVNIELSAGLFYGGPGSWLLIFIKAGGSK